MSSQRTEINRYVGTKNAARTRNFSKLLSFNWPADSAVGPGAMKCWFVPEKCSGKENQGTHIGSTISASSFKGLMPSE